MRASTILGSLLYAATAFAQAVPEGIAPDESSPDGCEQTVEGNFTIGIAISVGVHKRESASEAAGEALGCSLKDGVLKDGFGRVGSIVANYQFQFDGPPQAGAIYTGGFSRCQNASLAIGGSTRWWRCMSGDFGNLYDRSIGDQCSEIRIVALLADQPTPSSSSSSAASSTSASTATSTVTSSTWSVESASTTATLLPVISSNATVSTGTPTGSTSLSTGNSVTSAPSSTSTGLSSVPSSGSTGGAVPTRVPRRETFGAVIGILGAALII